MEVDVPCRDLGVPQEFLDHASRGEVLADLGLTAQDLSRKITGWVAAMTQPELEHDAAPQESGDSERH